MGRGVAVNVDERRSAKVCAVRGEKSMIATRREEKGKSRERGTSNAAVYNQGLHALRSGSGNRGFI